MYLRTYYSCWNRPLISLFVGVQLMVLANVTQAQIPDELVGDGWVFVRELDSNRRSRVLAYGDTVIFMVDTGNTRIAHKWLVSYDRGETISHEFAVPSPLPRIWWFPREDPDIFYLPGGYVDDTIIIVRKEGRVIDTILIDRASFNLVGTVSRARAWLDPHDAGTVYLEYIWEDKWTPDSRVFRSRDTGRTWVEITEKLPRTGPGVMREFIMDVRQPGSWYVMASGGEGLNLRWYRTYDDGETFYLWTRPVYEYRGEQVGIGAIGELRKSWGPDIGSGLYRGIVRWLNDKPNWQPDTLRWADELLPGRPDTMKAYNGNRFGFSDYDFSPANPDHLLLPISQTYSVDGKPDVDSFWKYYSDDAGENWKPVSRATKAVIATMDYRYPNTIWAVVAESNATRRKHRVYYKVFAPRAAVERKSGTEDATKILWSAGSILTITNVASSVDSIHLDLIDIAGRLYDRFTLTPQQGVITINLASSQGKGATLVAVWDNLLQIRHLVPMP